MLFAPTVELPATAKRGVLYGASRWVPPAATHVTAQIAQRGDWPRLGPRQTVVELGIEINQRGTWDLLAGCTTDASPKRNRSGQLSSSTSIRTRLPQSRIPQPQIRVMLRCLTPCPGAVSLLFDDAPVPLRQRQEHHSVTYDNDNEATANDATSITIGAFTVGNNANRCMLVGCASYDGTVAESAISSISHNGSTTGWASVITELGPGATNDRASIWRKVAPDAVNATVVVTMGGTCSEIGANALSVYDVDQTTPIGTPASAEGTTSSPATVNVSSATGEMVYDAVYQYGGLTGTGTEGAGQTPRANAIVRTYAGARTLFFASTEPGAPTVTMSWALSSPSEWVIVACPIKATAAAAGHPTLKRHGGIRYGARHMMRGVY